jgi:hypothetical protein
MLLCIALLSPNEVSVDQKSLFVVINPFIFVPLFIHFDFIGLALSLEDQRRRPTYQPLFLSAFGLYISLCLLWKLMAYWTDLLLCII